MCRRDVPRVRGKEALESWLAGWVLEVAFMQTGWLMKTTGSTSHSDMVFSRLQCRDPYVLCLWCRWKESQRSTRLPHILKVASHKPRACGTRLPDIHLNLGFRLDSCKSIHIACSYIHGRDAWSGWTLSHMINFALS